MIGRAFNIYSKYTRKYTLARFFSSAHSTDNAQKISPSALNLIELYKLDIGNITPTGPKGIILKSDVNDFLASKGITSPPSPSSAASKPHQKAKSAKKSKPSYPSHELVGLPSVSPTMTSGKIVKWLKKEGDRVSPGDGLFEIETDKAVMTYEVTDKGVLAKILVQEGADSLPLGHPIAVMVTTEKDVEAFRGALLEHFLEPEQGEEKEESQMDVMEEKQGTHKTEMQDRRVEGRIFISPFAKKLSKEMNVDYSKLVGTGPRGRIVAEDIMAASKVKKEVPKEKPAVAKPTVATTTATPGLVSRPGYKDIEHSNIRRVTAERLSFSKQSIPHYYLSLDVQVDKLLELRSKLNTYSPVKISVNDMIIKAAAKACQEVPMVNASWQDNFVRVYDYVDISIAVQTEKGLLTPIVKDAHTKTISEISKNVKELAEKAKASKLKPEEFQGGTFTISNLGMFGIKQFVAVINPPQAAILAVGASEKKVLVDDSGAQSISSQLTVTLSCDHRVIDGAIGAQWLSSFKKYIEDPFKMLV
jgi:pyruvate dehydrogenase E2 component (dihydrolipoamide acetyltransferase)